MEVFSDPFQIAGPTEAGIDKGESNAAYRRSALVRGPWSFEFEVDLRPVKHIQLPHADP